MCNYVLHLQLIAASWLGGSRRRLRPASIPGDAGQTTAEYALVLLGAAAIAMLIVTWASHSDFVGTLMGFIVDKIKGAIGIGG